MNESRAVGDALRAFYDAFNTAEVESFAAAIAEGDGVSVIGSAPGEGHASRAEWLSTYESLVPEAGLRLETGDVITAYEGGETGYATDEPSFVLPDGARLRTRLTAVLTDEGDGWKIVHAHFSVGVPDEEAIEPGSAPGASDGTAAD